MKASIKLIPWIVIGTLIILLFFQRSCQKPCPHAPLPDTITVVHYDTIVDSFFVKQPIPYTTVHSDTVILYDETLCNEYINAFYNSNIYLDTLLNDTSAMIAVRDTVTMNMLQHRKLYFINRRPSVTQNIITTLAGDTVKRNKVFIGLLLGRSPSEFTLGASLMLVTKKDAAYSLNFDPVFKNIYGSIFYKIKLKRK